MEKFELKIIGRSVEYLPEKLLNVLSYSQDKQNEILMFCDFSEFDIPTGYVFKDIVDIINEKEFSGYITLKNVSQQFALSYDMIPKGHKTICKFEVREKEILTLIKSLPMVEDWKGHKPCLILK